MIRLVWPGVVRGRIRAPPSKSYTHRALVSAFLASSPVTIHHPLDSDDTRATAEGLRKLGGIVTRSPGEWTVRPAPRPSHRSVTIDCRESGTSLRLLTAVAALQDRPVRFTGRGRLPHRPMRSLLEPLKALGATVHRERPATELPFVVQGPISPGEVLVSASESSQPVSALLLAGSALPGRTHIRLRTRGVSRPYIDATCAWLRSLGVPVARRGASWTVTGPFRSAPREVAVPGDASSASYLWAGAAATGGTIEVEGVDPRWPQADLRILELLRRMGAEVRTKHGGFAVSGALRHGVSADLTDSPDLYPLVGVLAALVPDTVSLLRGAPHLKHKESDRLDGTVRLVQSMGAEVVLRGGAVRIRGTSRPRALRLERLTDHRLVMSAAIAGLAAPSPSHIGDALAVGKSFPTFWSTLAHLAPMRGRP